MNKQSTAKAAKKRGRGVAAEEELFVQIQRTAEALMWGVAELLKASGLTTTQYNALRILRGAGADGLACREVSERMIQRDPDITRLLDRLEAQGLVRRERAQQDRRIVTAYVTQAGLDVLAALDAPVAELHQRQLGHLGAQRVAALQELLEQARESVG
ncbi:MAG TPA: MarR family transcriptional regulator [Pyrinomonadaceae bacterium]|nr:MarR family transcriptional regulator [Pyrinomonadaceae bacterium]